MRPMVPATIVLSLAFLTPAMSARPTQSQDATTVLAAARAALGGKALDGVRSFTATGSSVLRVLESTVSWRMIEISVDLPEKYVQTTRRTDSELSVPDLIIDYAGFNGSALLDSAASRASWHLMPPRGTTGPMTRPSDLDYSTERRLQRQKEAFLRLMLPLFAAGPAGISLQSESGGQTHVDGRLTNVVVLKTINRASFRLHVDAATHLPLKLAWTASRVSRDEAVTSSPAPARRAAGARAVEWATTFSDYRTEAGVTWPRRLTTWVGERLFEDVRLRSYKINVPLSARTFDPRR
jgi:hypothetical protein